MDTDIVRLLPHLNPKRDILRKYTVWLFLLFIFSNAAATRSPVKTLAGYSGTLPFKLETGYVKVGEREDVEIFYFFFESERDPATDPLMLWFTGGPGCSGFSAIFLEIGPLMLDLKAFDGRSLPKLLLRPQSWTKIANIIFLDSPVGAGFSYATTSEGYHSSDTKNAEDIYTFLQKWFVEHPEFIKNRLYIAGDSFGGKWVPMVTFKIIQGMEAGHTPNMNIKGYVIGNPFTDFHIDENSKITFAHRMGLISDEYYEMAKVNCRGEYVNPDPSNAQCSEALQLYAMCTEKIFIFNVLHPYCEPVSANAIDRSWSIIPQESKCRNDTIDAAANAWMNDLNVRRALHVQNGTVKEWIRCNRSVWYDQNLDSVVNYHKLLLSNNGVKALVYSGDVDLRIPYVGTQQWIRLLNLTNVDDWRPWFLDSNIAGYTERYVNSTSKSSLTFATVKGAGHTAPEYKPEECFAMINRFFESSPL